MKHLKIICIVLIMMVVVSCECDDPIVNESVPFKFEFTSMGGPIEGDETCGPPPVFRIKQEGSGSGTLGDFEFFSTFCNNVQTGAYFADDSESNGYFKFSNGDKLVLGPKVPGQQLGQILPSDKPDFDLMFQDPVSFEGGTGKFEGATGGGFTNSYVKLAEGTTYHTWTGSITLKK